MTTSRHTPAQPQYYVSVPQQLITLLADTPLAIGLYALVARLYFATHAPVPLSRGDIQRYDPTLREGAIKRALDRLVAGGWLLEIPGPKTRYSPTWGRGRNGSPFPWRMGAKYLGCPRHIYTHRLDCNILDIYMGKLTPQTQNTALIERYVSSPLLGLRDIGSYLLMQAGQRHHATPALLRWQLVSGGQVLPIPSVSQVLALASQRRLDDEQFIEITEAGWRKLGYTTRPNTASKQASNAQPLFFVPPGLIGDLIPQSISHLIGDAPQQEAADFALETAIPAFDQATPTIPWNQNSNESLNQPSDQPISPTTGGGSTLPSSRSKNKNNQRFSIPATETAQLLHTLGVLPEVIVELAHMPVEQVELAIAHGRARAQVRDLAGWVVKLLRTVRDYEWVIPQSFNVADQSPIDAERYTNSHHGDLFRLGSDTSDLETLTDLQVAPPLTDHALLAIPDSIREQLLLGCERQHRRVIERLHIAIDGDTTLIKAASLADAQTVREHLLGKIRQVLADLSAPTKVRIMSQLVQNAYQTQQASSIPTISMRNTKPL